MGWRDRFAFLGLVLFSLSSFLSTAGASIGLALLGLAFVAEFDRWRVLLSSPVTFASVVAVAFVVTHTLVFALLMPDSAAALAEGAADWLKLLWFVPFAFCLDGRVRRVLWALALALAGLLIGMAWRLDWAALLGDPAAYLGSRQGFGFPDIAFALYSGTALLGLVTLGGRVVGRAWFQARWRVALRFLGWLVAVGVLTQGFIQTQSRGAWLAMGLTLPLILFLKHRQFRARGATWSRWSKVSAGIAFLLVALLLAANGERLVQRLGAEADQVQDIVSGSMTDVSGSSYGQRWHVLLFGLEKWSERPWLGWGADMSRELIRDSDREQLYIDAGRPLRHLHNTYLEALVQFGIIGLGLLALPILWLATGTARACRERRLPPDLCLFFGGALLFTLLWSLFDYRLAHHDWRVFWILLAGSAYSLILKWPAGDADRTAEG